MRSNSGYIYIGEVVESLEFDDELVFPTLKIENKRVKGRDIELKAWSITILKNGTYIYIFAILKPNSRVRLKNHLFGLYVPFI